MARINKRALTKLEIVQVASRQFLEKGYSATTVSAISKELGISPGNLTFHFPTKEHLLAELVDLVESGAISGKIGKDVLAEMFASGKGAKAIVAERGLAQVSDAGAIEGMVDQVLAANPAQVEQFRAGNPKVLQFLVGQVMKISRGKANPKLVSEVLNRKLQ